MRLRGKIAIVLMLFMMQGALQAESLFESTTSDQGQTTAQVANKSDPGFSLYGFIKSGIYLGQNEQFKAAVLGDYGELDLKMDVVKNKLGRAFADIRYFSDTNNLDIREAWVETSIDVLNIRLGRQIIVWGRADSINPTNNITPVNSFVFSSEFDDMRLSNDLLQLTYKISTGLSLNGIWVPIYKSDTIIFDKTPLPASILIGQNVYPGNGLDSGSAALRLDFNAGVIDGSVSYYYGYNVMPGFDYALTAGGMAIIPTAYRMQAIGGDFSTSLTGFGLRGEICAKIPEFSQSGNVYIPAPFIQYVFGIDRIMGDFNALVQYSGQYVTDFQQIDYATMNAAALQMETYNRLFTGTAEQVSHSATAQVGWTGLSDTLHVKLAGVYNFTTREYVISPSVTYDIADAMIGTVGFREVDGPDSSLNHLMKNTMSLVYVELKCSY